MNTLFPCLCADRVVRGVYRVGSTEHGRCACGGAFTITIPDPTPEQRATRTLGPITVECGWIDLLEGRRDPLPPMEWWDALGFLFLVDGLSRQCHDDVMRALMEVCR